MSGVAVSVQDITKAFTTEGRTTRAVAGVTFEAQPSEFVTLIGPSGCGKTTVMRMIGDLVEPSSGEILVDGDHPRSARQRRLFGHVFQEATLLSWRTLVDNVRLPLQVLKRPARESKERAMELLELVGLQDFASFYPDQVSGGMQQRAAIARALSFDPAVLLMDEPFGALDLITRDKMSFELLRIWEEQKKTVLFVTHSIQEAVLLSDRVVVFSARPSRILEVVSIDLPRPRTAEHRDSPEFAEYARHLREMLE